MYNIYMKKKKKTTRVYKQSNDNTRRWKDYLTY